MPQSNYFNAEVVCESNPKSSKFLITVKTEDANEERCAHR